MVEPRFNKITKEIHMLCPRCREWVEVIDPVMANYYSCIPCRGKSLAGMSRKDIADMQRERNKARTNPSSGMFC